jgi:flagellar biosynthesis protein FlhF
MRVKTFKAMDMKEALRIIKEEMGPQAVILSTRQVTAGKRAFGLLGRPMVEVTAAVDDGGDEDGKGSAGNNGSLEQMGGLEEVRARIEELREEVWRWFQCQRGSRPQVPSFWGGDPEDLRGFLSFLVRQCCGESPLVDSGIDREIFLRLIRQGVKEGHALRMVERVCRRDPGSPRGERIKDLQRLLARLIRVQDPLEETRERPVILALVGPTGVGKTTTVAKMAARCALQEGRRVALVTNDTYRIAAVEQLRTYARILRIPLEVVVEPVDLQRSLKALEDRDLILMDTTGRSPLDGVELIRLKELLEADTRIRSLLLVNANTDVDGLERVLSAFLPLGPQGLIVTKLDESIRFGAIFSAVLQSRLPLTYVTTGQRVPEDFRKASSEEAAQWTLWGLPSFYEEAAGAA